MANYVTLNQAKRFIGIPTGVTMHDTLIESNLIPMAEVQVCNYCGVSAITVTTYTEKYNISGGGISEVVLRNFPVSSVAGVTDDGSAVSASNYYLNERAGVVSLTGSGSFFTDGRQKVEIKYTAGTNPEVRHDLKYGTAMLVAFHFNASRNVGLTFEKSGRYQYKRSTSGMPDAVAAILAPYVRAFAMT